MNFKVGDKVVVIAGKDKGKEGKIIKTLKNKEEILNNSKYIILNPKEYKGKWNFWQHTDCGKVTGIKGNVDCNIFNGSFEDLMNLTIPEQEDNYTDPEDSL